MTSEQEKLITSNMKLVYFVHKKYMPKFEPDVVTTKEDLFSEGYIGLVRAAQTYDPSSKNAFSTYAIFCIRNQMLMALRKCKKCPANKYISLDSLVCNERNNDTVELEALISNSYDIEENYIYKEKLAAVEELLNINPPELKQIIKLYSEGYSQTEIATMTGISKSQVNKKKMTFVNRAKYIIENDLMPNKDKYSSKESYEATLKKLYRTTQSKSKKK